VGVGKGVGVGMGMGVGVCWSSALAEQRRWLNTRSVPGGESYCCT